MAIVLVILAYFLGSVPFGLVVAKGMCGVDPRTVGSGNVGATNVARNCGLSAGILTLALDLLKGLVPVAVALDAGLTTGAVSLTALAVLVGHCYSVFLGFQGGKAVATTVGVFLPIAWVQTVLAVAVLLLVLGSTGFMSVASLSLITSLFLFLLFSGKLAFLPLAFAVLLLIFWRHRENVLRLARGEEHPWRKTKSKPEPNPEEDA